MRAALVILVMLMAGCATPSDDPGTTPRNQGPEGDQRVQESPEDPVENGTVGPSAPTEPAAQNVSEVQTIYIGDGVTTIRADSSDLQVVRIVSNMTFQMNAGGHSLDTENGYVFLLPEAAADCQAAHAGVVIDDGDIELTTNEFEAGSYWAIGMIEQGSGASLQVSAGDVMSGHVEFELRNAAAGWGVLATRHDMEVAAEGRQASVVVAGLSGDVFVTASLSYTYRVGTSQSILSLLADESVCDEETGSSSQAAWAKTPVTGAGQTDDVAAYVASGTLNYSWETTRSDATGSVLIHQISRPST